MLLKALAITLTFCIFHSCTYCHLKTEQIWSLVSNEKQGIFFWFCNSVESATCSPCRTVTQGSHFQVSEQESAHNVYLPKASLTSLFLTFEAYLKKHPFRSLTQPHLLTAHCINAHTKCCTYKNTEGS